MSRDITDLLGDLISDSYGGESTETCVPPISTLLAAQDEIVKLRLASYEQASKLGSAMKRVEWYESNLTDKRNPHYDPDTVEAARQTWPLPEAPK